MYNKTNYPAILSVRCVKFQSVANETNETIAIRNTKTKCAREVKCLIEYSLNVLQRGKMY